MSRRRLYLMRHADVAYFDADGKPMRPQAVPLTPAGIEQAPGCINVLDVGEHWIVRAVNVAPYDLVHRAGRQSTMERLYSQYRP